MATLKQRLHRKSVSGFYDVVHLESDATVIKINSDDTETKTVSDYLPKIQDTDDTPTGINPGQIVTGTSKVFVCTGDGTIRTFKEVAGGSVPVKDKDFTYSGNCEVIDDTDEVSGVQWRIKFLTSGILVVIEQWLADLFLVGGGNGSQAGVSAVVEVVVVVMLIPLVISPLNQELPILSSLVEQAVRQVHLAITLILVETGK